MKRLKLLLFGIFLSSYHTIAQTLSDTEAKMTWNELQKQPLTEQSFRKVCDLIQDTGKSNLNLSYAWLKDYVPKVQAAGQWQWAHMLLMAWARAKESFGVFDESEILYQKTLRNAPLNSEQYREALVGLVFLYNHWEKADSSAKYLALGEASAKAANDRENLAFFYTLHAAYHIAPNDVKSRENFYRQAIKLTEGLNDKNAEFTARYNFVVNFLDENPAQQVAEAEALLELAKDSSLTRRPRFYERSNFWFRNPIPTLYFYMLQQNLILADNSNANQFADLLNEVVIKPNLIPTQTPFFTTQMAFTKATIGQYKQAKNYLKQTQTLLQLPEKDIPFPNYFTAAGLVAEYEKRPQSALLYHQQALEKGSTAAFYFMPAPLYYAHALTLTGAFEKAKNILQTFDTLAHSRPYSATGLYYYQYLAELEKARGLLPQHLQHLQTYHTIKDSLTNLNRYRAIQQVLAKVGLREKEQQVVRLNKEKNARELQIKRERLLYGAIISTAVLAIVFLMLYLRNRQIRNRQTLELKQAELEQLKKQRHIDLIKGIMEAEENERRKVADQLHDEVNSSLALVSLNVSSVLEKGLTDAHSEPKLTKAYEVLGNVSTTIRNISHRLTPLLIERYGFGHAVQDLADTVNLSGKLHLDTLVIGIEENPHYSISFLHDVFKIIQELIQNTLKHAQATEAFVEVVEQPNHTLSVMVEDNGLGLKPFPLSEGKGLSSIRAKVKYLGGKIEIQNAPNGGTLVVIEHLVPRSE